MMRDDFVREESGCPQTDSYYIPPKAAMQRLRKARPVHQTVYIWGGTGYGKTSLIANFPAKKKWEYFELKPSLPGFEEILEQLQSGSARERVVVLDGMQNLTEDADRRLIYPVLEQLMGRPEVWLILISRCALPAWLKPLYIKRMFVLIGEEELRLKDAEMSRFFESWGLALTPSAETRLQTLSEGNPVFLRIMAMKLLPLMQPGQGNSQDQAQKELEAIEEARRDWWDYLESRVFEQWDGELQAFLMDLSVVERFDLQMAQLITRKSDAGRCIRMAQEAGHILNETVENGRVVYEMIFPAKAALRRRLASRCSQQHISALYTSAGSACELQGRILEALSLYSACGDEEGIARLLTENARRYVGIGHYWEMRRYYLALSEETILKSPELMSGMSMLQSIQMNDEESDRWYKELENYARRQIGRSRQEAEGRLLYLDIALPHQGINRLPDLLVRAKALIVERKSLLPEVSLTNNQPSLMDGGKDFFAWNLQIRKLARTIGPMVELALGQFGKGLVNLALAECIFESGGDNYEVSTLANKGRMQAESGGKLEMVFVSVGVLTRLSLINNYLEDALESLKSFRVSAQKDAPWLLGCINALRARCLLYAGRSAELEEWMKEAPDEDKEFCTLERYRYMTKARVYLAQGRREKALRLLQRVELFAQKRNRVYLRTESLLLMAVAQYRMGEGPWQETLQKAVSQAEEYGFVRVITREGAALWPLLRSTELNWKNPDFKRRVMNECEHIAGLYPAYMSERQGGNVTLSEKALKVLRLQAQGLSVEQIAAQLGLSRAGVKYYNQETYKKLGVSSKAAAITAARDRKLL